MKERKKVRYRFIYEGLLALIIALTPIIFYSHKYIPEGQQEIEILFFTVSSNGFPDAVTSLYYYLTKLIPLILLIIWFVTCRNWWYHAILIPISMYAFQLYTVFNAADSLKVDENEILYVVVITMVIVPIVYFIRIKLFDKHVHGIDLDAMDTELQILKEKEELRKEREKLEKSQKTLSKKM